MTLLLLCISRTNEVRRQCLGKGPPEKFCVCALRRILAV